MLSLQIFNFIRKCETYHDIINNKNSLIQNERQGKREMESNRERISGFAHSFQFGADPN